MPYHPSVRAVALACGMSLLSACGGGGGGGGGSSAPAPSPTSSTAANYICPSSDTDTSVARNGGVASATSEAPHTGFGRGHGPAPSTTLLGVAYSSQMEAAQHNALVAREQGLGATFVHSTVFAHVGITVHLLSVPSASGTAIESSLRSEPGVKEVGFVGRRQGLTVSQQYWPNNPYFNGFSTTVAPTPGATDPPSTYHVGPYEESNDVPGQWDMHAIGLGDAFEYSQSGNGSGITNASALGSSSIKIAIIDTGEDTQHPELSSKITYQKCFITYDGSQSTSNYTTDPLGHGTDVSGIAAAELNSGIGFAGAGGDVVIYGYRVFPTPDNSCLGDNPDNTCSADTTDIASAIDDAISKGVNVISMSLGGCDEATNQECCPNGIDPDPYEGPAVQAAISDGITVVAAAGNNGPDGEPPVQTGIDAPACGSGVIAVGATGLADGSDVGTPQFDSDGTVAAPLEYVAGYSQYGSPARDYQSSSAWGIVAPGGDAENDDDADDLHWIENIWTTTPFTANDAGNCEGDYPTDSGTADCRILIDGTSMATPHVAGAAALILSIGNSSYKSPAEIKALLCSTSDDLGSTYGSDEGCGRLNIYRAMAVAVGDSATPTPEPVP